MSATKLKIDEQRTELKAAFRAFGSVSEHLSGAFDALRGQVARLQHDLTEAHAGNEHLAARMSALVKGLPGGALVLDAQGAIFECNPAAIELRGEGWCWLRGAFFGGAPPPPLNCWASRCWPRLCRRCLSAA